MTNKTQIDIVKTIWQKVHQLAFINIQSDLAMCVSRANCSESITYVQIVGLKDDVSRATNHVKHAIANTLDEPYEETED